MNRRQFSGVLGVALGSTIAASGCRFVEEGQAAATYGCIVSIQSGLNYGKASDLRLEATPTEEWQTVSDDEAGRLVSVVAEQRSLDCRGWTKGKPLLDPWNQRIEVAARRRSGKIEFRVWSKGLDGKDETADDIRVRISDEPSGVASPR